MFLACSSVRKKNISIFILGNLKFFFGFDNDLTKAEEKILFPGDVFFIPPGLRHKMLAEEDTELFEFSTHHEEEDSLRIIKRAISKKKKGD